MPGTAKIENGRGTATILLSKAPGVADTVQKIREGVIRNVSVGYWVHEVVKTEGSDGTVARWDVTDWEPLEISAVPVPADAGSQIRSTSSESAEEGPQLRSCLFITRSPASRPKTPATPETPMANRTPKTAAPKGARTAKSPAEIEAEKKRKAEERAAARRAATRSDDEDEDRSEEDEEERDEDSDEDRDGDEAEDGDGERSEDSDEERDEDDSDEERDDDEEDGERAASRSTGRSAPKKGAALTRAEVREAAEAAVRADRVRSGKIRELAAQFGFPKLGERHASKGTSVRAFKEVVLERLAERQAKRGSTTFAAASTAGVGETYGGATPKARDFDKGAAEARALLGKK